MMIFKYGKKLLLSIVLTGLLCFTSCSMFGDSLMMTDISGLSYNFSAILSEELEISSSDFDNPFIIILSDGIEPYDETLLDELDSMCVEASLPLTAIVLDAKNRGEYQKIKVLRDKILFKKITGDLKGLRVFVGKDRKISEDFNLMYATNRNYILKAAYLKANGYEKFKDYLVSIEPSVYFSTDNLQQFLVENEIPIYSEGCYVLVLNNERINSDGAPVLTAFSEAVNRSGKPAVVMLTSEFSENDTRHLKLNYGVNCPVVVGNEELVSSSEKLDCDLFGAKLNLLVYIEGSAISRSCFVEKDGNTFTNWVE